MDSLGAAPRFSISRWLAAIIWICAIYIAGPGARVAEAEAPIEVYGHLPTLEDLALSPDGTKLVLVRTSEDERNLYIKPLTENKVLGAAHVGDAKLRSIEACRRSAFRDPYTNGFSWVLSMCLSKDYAACRSTYRAREPSTSFPAHPCYAT